MAKVKVSGFDCFFEGLSLIGRPGLRQYVIVPTVINIAVLAGLIVWGGSQYDAVSQYIRDSLPDWLSFLSGVFAFLSALVALFVLLYLFTIVAGLIASPFNALLSVKVEEKLTGRSPESNAGLLTVLVRSVVREVVKLLYYLPRLVALVILTLIPAVNAAAPVAWIVFGAWMMAVQFADYAADNNEVSFGDLRALLGRRKIDALGFGILAYLALAIPVLNLVLMPAAVAGGTALWVHRLRDA
ncbi:MAG: sulfate transporter CysZ [Pseudomonadales bacterium]|nr:sulfate transporter CysZ [Pseudomonadales bacterium]